MRQSQGPGVVVQATGLENGQSSSSVKQAAFACWIGVVLLGFMCLAAAYKWELEEQFDCDETNCVTDRRGWVEAHPLPSVVLVVLALAGLILLAVHLHQRRRGDRPRPDRAVSP